MLQVVVDEAGLKAAHFGLVAGEVSCEVDFVLLQVLDVGLERQYVLVGILINGIKHGVEFTVVIHFSFKNLVALFKVRDVVCSRADLMRDLGRFEDIIVNVDSVDVISGRRTLVVVIIVIVIWIS